jgi:Phage tail lysozyme
VAEQLLASAGGAPATTIGGGLAALGQAIGGRLALGRVDRAEAAGRAGADAAFAPLFGGGTAAPPETAALPGTEPVATGGTAAVAAALASGGDFSTTAASVIPRLSQDLGITPQQAAGIVGQLGHESEGLKAINERRPTVPGSRGGFGWAQWTGPRRVAFERWAKGKGLSVTDPEANYGFLLHELKETPEGRVLARLRQAPDAITAGRVFTKGFLRPGVVNQASRDAWTNRALETLGGGGGGTAAVADALAGGIRDDVLGGGPLIDPRAKDDLYQPVAAGPDDLGTSDPAYRKMLEERAMSGITVPQTAGAVPLPGAAGPTPAELPSTEPVSAPPPAAPPVAPGAPAAAGVAPVARALGIDPLPQTSGLVGPVASAGHESLSPAAQAVSAALSGGAGTDTLAGGGGRGFLGRLFGPRGPAAAPGGVPGETAAVPGTEPVSGVPPTSAVSAAGGFSPRAQAAIAFLQHPYANKNPGQVAIAKAILEQEIEQADPKYRVDLERARTELEQLKTGTRQLTPEELTARGLDPNSKLTIDAKGNISEVPQPKPIAIDNRLIDPTTHEVIYEPPPGTKILTRAEAIDNRLDPDLGTWTMDRDGKPALVEGTERPDLINVGGGWLYDQTKKEWIKTPDVGKPEVKLTDEASFRKEVAAQEGHSRYNFAQPVLSSMISSLYDPSSAADFDFVYGVAQIFDPNSVVKESEGQRVIDSQSIPEAIKGRLNQLLNQEGAIGRSARRELIATAARRIEQYGNQAKREEDFFTGVAKRRGIDEAFGKGAAAAYLAELGQ